MKLGWYLRAKERFAKGDRKPPTSLGLAFEKAAQDFAKEAGVKPPEPDWMDIAAPFVERWEGLHRLIPGDKVVAYPDPGTNGAPWTIGIGSTTDEDGKPISRDTVWTVERARNRFRAHLQEFGEGVDKALDGTPVNAHQKAALTSLAYNIGLGAFGRSTVLRMHRRGEYEAAADAFLMWVKAGGKTMRGLERRRKAERELYLT